MRDAFAGSFCSTLGDLGKRKLKLSTPPASPARMNQSPHSTRAESAHTYVPQLGGRRGGTSFHLAFSSAHSVEAEPQPNDLGLTCATRTLFRR